MVIWFTQWMLRTDMALMTNHLLNPNHSAHYEGTVGMKTGTTTPAGQCLITGVFKDNRLIIVAIMYAGDSGRDAASLAVYKKIFE